MLWLPLILTANLTARFSPADRAAMATLGRAVTALEDTKNQKRFERLAPRSNVFTWQRLQRQFVYPRLGAANLAFALAYYGVDYQQNVQRLLIPYQRRSRGITPKTDAASEHEFDLMESLPDDLMLLHQKHHDTYSLVMLLDLKLDGAAAEEQADALTTLWDNAPATLLRLCAGSSTRLRNLEDSLQLSGDDLKERRSIFAQLRRLGHHRDQRVAHPARTVAADLKRAFKSGG